MFKNYFRVAIRNLWKDKVSAFVNILGLSIGLACCMLIVIYIQHERSYNRFNKNFETIYRVKWVTNVQGQVNTDATTPIVLGPAIAKDIPQISHVSRLYQRSGQMEVAEDGDKKMSARKFQEQQVYFADNDFFSVFSVSFLQGPGDSALSSPNSIVLTDEMAKKYFGDADPVGKSFLYDNKILVRVVAVVKKMPVNSDIHFDFLISFESLFSVEKPEIADYLKTDWNYNPAYTYVILKQGAKPSQVNAAINQLVQRYGDKRAKELYSVSIDPLKDLHLYSASVTDNPSTGSIIYIYIFSGIALLVLLIASVNYINLATARSSTRSREVGMRKVLGASKRQLIIQFLGENLLTGTVAFLLALAFTDLALPLLNDLTGRQIPRFSWINWSGISVFVFLFFSSSVLAGIYPAFFISSFQPLVSMKRRSGETGSKQLLRKTLLVTQFCICILLITGSVVIYKQVQYLHNKPLGFKKEQVVAVPLFGSGSSSIGYGVDIAMRQRMNLFTEKLMRNTRIKAATAASALPGQGFVKGLVIPEGYRDEDNIFVPWISVDYNFLSALQIPLVAGRDFSKATGTDHLQAFIISESALRTFNWKNAQDAIGKNIIRGDSKNGKKGHVIGVVRDFIFNPLDQPMEPLIVDVNVARFNQFAISIQADHIPETISFIRQQWNEIFPERVFEYGFLDKDIQTQYQSQENLGKMTGYFTVIAILLSCMGLFSLTSFLTTQRSGEIGIRKVLGAGISDILVLLIKDFLVLGLIACLIASPISWFAMNHWLQQYAFRTELSWWIFPAAGILIFLVTILTVSYQSMRAAISNPVDAIRTE